MTNQESQQQHPTASGFPQPSFFPGEPGFPTSNSVLQQFSRLTKIPSSSNQRQAASPNLVFCLANQDSPPSVTNQQQQSASIFLAKQDFQQQQPTRSGVPRPTFTLANQDSTPAADFRNQFLGQPSPQLRQTASISFGTSVSWQTGNPSNNNSDLLHLSTQTFSSNHNSHNSLTPIDCMRHAISSSQVCRNEVYFDHKFTGKTF